ncbi:MAG TPA: hypothetical protein VL948_10675 [Verrucomicrobiae bacterium]|nr:hypothetical protein [Verrucomicrobiae bacterium]
MSKTRLSLVTVVAMTFFAGCATTPKVAIYRDPATGTEHTCKGTGGFASSGSVTEYADAEAAYNSCKDRMEALGYERVKR